MGRLRGKLLSQCAILVLLILILLPLWTVRYIPLEEFGDWAFEAKILANYHSPEYDFARWYQVKKYPLSNILSQLIMAGMMRVWPEDIVCKIFLTVSILLFLAGVFWFFHRVNKSSQAKYLAFTLAWSAVLMRGRVNNYLGDAIVFWTLGLLWRGQKKAGLPRYLLASLLLALAFFSHAAPFLFLAFAVAILVMFTAEGRLKRLALLCSPSFILSLAYLWYLRSHPEPVAARFIRWWGLKNMVVEWVKSLGPFYSATFDTSSVLPAAILNLLFILSLIIVFSVVLLSGFRNDKKDAASPESRIIMAWFAASMTIFLLGPNQLLSCVNFNGRFAPFAIAFGFAWLSLRDQNKSMLSSVVFLAWAALIPLWNLYLFRISQPAYSSLDRFIAENMNPDSKTFYFYFYPRTRLPAYLHLAAYPVTSLIPHSLYLQGRGCSSQKFITGIISLNKNCWCPGFIRSNYIIDPFFYFPKAAKSLSYYYPKFFLIGPKDLTIKVAPLLEPYFSLKAESRYALYFEARGP